MFNVNSHPQPEINSGKLSWNLNQVYSSEQTMHQTVNGDST